VLPAIDFNIPPTRVTHESELLSFFAAANGAYLPIGLGEVGFEFPVGAEPCLPVSGAYGLLYPRIGISHCDIGKGLTIDFDTCKVEPVDKAAVAHAVEPACSINALNPELSHFALACPAIAVAVLERVHDGLVGRTEGATPVSVVALCSIEYCRAM
jgi:hypothetical protein